MIESESILWMSVIAITAGVIAQILSVFAGTPSIVFLFVTGIVIGPEVLGFLHPEVFGEGLETIIKLCVAIILFEAGLSLDRDEIKRHSIAILPLITYGGLITMGLGALCAYYIMDLSWSNAFLFGSLVIVTGPTVINPLLRRVRVKSRLKNILESEGVFIDPIGAIIAIFVFELIVAESPSFLHSSLLVLGRLGIGSVIGVVGGYLVAAFIRKWSLLIDEEIDLLVLASALGIYALSEAVIIESGLMAAVASGAVVGNMDIPGEETLRKFKGKLSILVISLLFILLAANLELEYMTSLGWGGVMVVLALLFIVRPVEIFLSTLGADLSFREKAFLSYICPRGIVAASIASIFVIEFDNLGIGGGDVVQGLVFLTIGISVLLQGVTANTVARMLGVLVETQKTVIVGANPFGILLGKLIAMNGREVGFIDTNEQVVQIARDQGFEAVEGNSLDPDKLEEIGIGEADTIVSVTTSNRVNLLVSQLAKLDFEIKNAIPLLNRIGGSLDRNAVTRLGLEAAFGKELDTYHVNSKVTDGEYQVFKCVVRTGIAGTKLEDLELPEGLIPLLIMRADNADDICRSGLTVESGNSVVFLDLRDEPGRLEGLGFDDCAKMEL